MDQSSINKRVEALYKAEPNLINSDKLLLARYWALDGLKLTDRQLDKYFQLPSAESITRAGRYARAKDEYELGKQVAEPVREGRFKKFLSFKRG